VRSFRFALIAPLLATGLLCAGPAHSRAQDKDTFTPMPMDSGFGKMDIREPAIKPEEIIKKFSAKESEFSKALNNYTYRRTVKLQEYDDDDKVDGEYFEVDDVIFDSTGRRTEHVVLAPTISLQRISMSPSDLQDIQHNLSMLLTTEEINNYSIKYVGKQGVDEVDCYVFDVTPKMIDKKKRYFLGRIWVDSEAMQIVVTNGRIVPDDTRKGHEDLHPPFMTWRQQIDGHYWFPVYTIGEGTLHFTGGSGYMAQDVHIRQTIKYSDYKQFHADVKIVYNGEEINKDNQAAPAPKPK
jgi:hypothetical protein